jgi:osmotically-inducible protein OsmY
METKMSSDLHLKNRILDEMVWAPNVDSAHIGVITHDGVVTLNGHVTNYSQKLAAERATGRVKGTKAIVNEIEIELSNGIVDTDEDIAKAAVSILSWDGSVPANSIKIAVSHGWVTLSGDVEWFYQKEAASDDIRRLAGVKGVTNQVVIKPTVDTDVIAEDIEFALNRSWFDTKRIKVSAKGSKVILTGKVDTWSDWQEASEVAWAAKGVTSIQNDILIV